MNPELSSMNNCFTRPPVVQMTPSKTPCVSMPSVHVQDTSMTSRKRQRKETVQSIPSDSEVLVKANSVLDAITVKISEPKSKLHVVEIDPTRKFCDCLYDDLTFLTNARLRDQIKFQINSLVFRAKYPDMFASCDPCYSSDPQGVNGTIRGYSSCSATFNQSGNGSSVSLIADPYGTTRSASSTTFNQSGSGSSVSLIADPYGTTRNASSCLATFHQSHYGNGSSVSLDADLCGASLVTINQS